MTPVEAAECCSACVFSQERRYTRFSHTDLTVLKAPGLKSNPGFLQALLEFLSKVVSRERKNKMNLWAVATIMAPNLFLHKAVPSRLTEGTEKGQAEKAADVMRLLIRYQDLLWTVGLPKEAGEKTSIADH